MKRIKIEGYSLRVSFTVFLFLTFFLINNSFSSPQPAATDPEIQSTPEKFTLDFNGTDILDALKIIASKSGGMNIIASPEVTGTVTVKLIDVTWDKALESVLEMNNLGYQKNGNIITVASIERINFLKKQNFTLATEVFNLKYLDAEYTRTVLMQLISPQGRISILRVKNQEGWEFSGGKGEAFSAVKRKASEKQAVTRSNILLVTDTPESIEKIIAVIKKIDVRPAQILIETKIMEVKQDKLKDMGLDWGDRYQRGAINKFYPNIHYSKRQHCRRFGRAVRKFPDRTFWFFSPGRNNGYCRFPDPTL